MFGNLSMKKARLKIYALSLTMVLITISIMRPVSGLKQSMISQKSSDIIFLIDVSNSMAATDIKPSRIDYLKFFVKKFIEMFYITDRSGIVIFAGSPFVLCPLTNDYTAFSELLDSADISSNSVQGTNFKSALYASADLLYGLSHFYNTNKMILLLTDGEDFSSEALSTVEILKKKFSDLKIYCIGVGSQKGSKILMKTGAVLKDNFNKEVITKYNENLLKNISLLTGSKYYYLNENTFDFVFKDLSSELKNINTSSKVIIKYAEKEYYKIFLIFAIVLILIETFISISNPCLDKGIE